MRREINVFKCIVNISSQDFGVYFRYKASKRLGSKAEQHGKSGEVVEGKSEVLDMVEWVVGGNGGWF